MTAQLLRPEAGLSQRIALLRVLPLHSALTSSASAADSAYVSCSVVTDNLDNLKCVYKMLVVAKYMRSKVSLPCLLSHISINDIENLVNLSYTKYVLSFYGTFLFWSPLNLKSGFWKSVVCLTYDTNSHDKFILD